MSVIEEIAAERRRQIDVEGFTAEHDDRWAGGEIADAASAYAYSRRRFEPSPPPWWEWAKEWWKPTDRRRDLIKAGALIVAEIERLDRKAGGRP